MDPVKPGVKTSEFYVTLVGMVVSGLVLLKLVPAAETATVTDQLLNVVALVGALATKAALAYAYIKSRVAAKAPAPAPAPEPAPQQP